MKTLFEIPDDQYHVIEGVGHIPMLEKGEEVGQILIDFLCLNSGLEAVFRGEEDKGGD